VETATSEDLDVVIATLLAQIAELEAETPAEEEVQDTTTVADEVFDACEYEGHKYDTDGTPLEGWEIGLVKYIQYEGQDSFYTISTDTTDADGFFCLRWTDSWTPEFDIANYPNGYTFEYRVYEANQPDWVFNSVETGAEGTTPVESTLEDITFTGEQVQVRVSEVNGYVVNDAEFHVDFYNRFVGQVEDNGTTTDVFSELTIVPTCGVSDDGVAFEVANTNDFAIDIVYSIEGEEATTTATVAANGVFTYSVASTTAATTTLTYSYDEVDYALTVAADATDCDEVVVTTTSSGGGGGSSAPRCDLFTVESVDGELAMAWETRRGYDLEITADGEMVFETTDDDIVDEGALTIADAGQTEFELTVLRGSRSDSCEVNFATPAGTVAGIADSNSSSDLAEATPEGLVLGEQVSVVPLGAADTGAGGAAAAATSALVLIAAAGSLVATRRFAK